MRWIVGFLGALPGIFLGMDLPARVYRLFKPAVGCMSSLDFLALLPILPFTVLLGGYLGAVGANRLLTRFWEWQVRDHQLKPLQKRRNKRRTPPDPKADLT